MSSPAYASVLAAALSLGACRDPITAGDGTGQSLPVAVGTEFDVTLQTVGPGEYASPPGISSGRVRFVEMSYVGALPSGPTQRFRFRAVSPGRAIVTFRHTVQTRVVQDTVEVQ